MRSQVYPFLRIAILTAAIFALGLGISLTAHGEEPPPNPFSGDTQPPPTDPGDFNDDFAEGEGGFGFAPPVPPPPPPPGGNVQNDPPSGGRAFSPPSGVPSMGNGQTPVSPVNPSRTAKAPAAPKLAEYLELDPSVKGLEVKNFDLPDKDIKDVVTLISKWTGKNFILDSKVRGKITIIGPSQVTLQEAYQAFLTALEANGLTTVQSGKFIRIIEATEARRSPVKTYVGEYAPKDDQFITRIFQLKYINADEVQREFRDLTTRQGKLFAYEPTNSIIITDTGSNIHRIREILEALDVKSFETTLHVLKIKNTSAKQISEMLGEIYGDNQKQGGGARSFRRSALERTRGGGIITKIIPDEQTNSLVILANQSGFESLKKLVAKLDVRVTDTGRIHVYYCEHAKAEDLAQTLASLASGSTGASRSSRARPSAPAAGGGAPPGGATGPTGPTSAELEGGVKVTADAATNALVITANTSDYKTLRRVIKKLDIPRLQVFIETAILDMTVDDQTEWGVNLANGVPDRGIGPAFIGNASSLINSLTGQPNAGLSLPFAVGNSWDVQVGSGQARTGVKVFSLMGLVSLITTNTRSSVLSTPQIIALDNEEAQFKVLDKIPVQSGTNTVQGVGTQQNISREEVGITIKLKPHVNAKSRIVRLSIEQRVDNQNNSLVPKDLGGTQIALTSRETNTQVTVKDGDFVMLGGLMSDKIDDAVTKVPLLGDIPIVGWLFKSKIYRKRKSNLVILLQPKIIGTSFESANLISENLEKRDRFVQENFAGTDNLERPVDVIKQKISEQKARGERQKSLELKSDEEEMEEEEEETKPEENLLEPSAQSGAQPKKEKRRLAVDPKSLTPPPQPRAEAGTPQEEANVP